MGISVEQLYLNYGKRKILQNLSFNVRKGEILALFGPSGAGKTSLLKMIAGIQPVKKGKITFNEDFSQEETILVFQDFWLFPHLTVSENIAFGLKAHKYAKSVIKTKTEKILEVFDLNGLEKNFPAQLSGGQKQRVALARALVLEPKLLLLDEPFANLDSHLKATMRQYLLKLQQEYQFSIILVTHDRDEAFQLADRMILLLDGKIQQIGSPKEIYFYPKNRTVAEAIGECNFLNGWVEKDCFKIGNSELLVQNPANLQGEAQLFIPSGTPVSLAKTGLQGVVESSRWSPNGQQTHIRINDTNCVLTNISEKVMDQEIIYLKFSDSLQVFSR